eukprot:Hpha_TRINITY_DN10849_c0_g1::TRINITY_DN10849_c0_g1_i1::g.23436::m.23436
MQSAPRGGRRRRGLTQTAAVARALVLGSLTLSSAVNVSRSKQSLIHCLGDCSYCDWGLLDASALAALPSEAFADAQPPDIACIPDAACSGLRARQLGAMGDQCQGWTGCFSYAPREAFAGITAQCLQRLQRTALFFIAPAQLAEVPPDVFAAGVTPDLLRGLPNKACAGFTVDQFAAFQQGGGCGALGVACTTHFTDSVLATMQAACVSKLRTDFFFDLPAGRFTKVPPACLAGMSSEQAHMLSDNICKIMSGPQLAALTPDGCGGMRGSCLSGLPGDTLHSLTGECAMRLSGDTLHDLSGRALHSIPLDAFSALTPSQLGSLRPGACAHMTTEQEHVVSHDCDGLTPECCAAAPRCPDCSCPRFSAPPPSSAAPGAEKAGERRLEKSDGAEKVEESSVHRTNGLGATSLLIIGTGLAFGLAALAWRSGQPTSVASVETGSGLQPPCELTPLVPPRWR